jgi:hypothetical protein
MAARQVSLLDQRSGFNLPHGISGSAFVYSIHHSAFHWLVTPAVMEIVLSFFILDQ